MIEENSILSKHVLQHMQDFPTLISQLVFPPIVWKEITAQLQSKKNVYVFSYDKH